MIVGLVPARGGSKGIKGKNLQVVDGKPLVLRAAETCATICDRVIIATDDPQIRGLCELWGYEVWDRPAELNTDDASVDDVVRWVGDKLATEREERRYLDGLLVIQPTVPQLDPRAVQCFVQDWFEEKPGVPWTMGVRWRHLMWGPLAPIRVQRQADSDWPTAEIGVRIYPPGDYGPPRLCWPVEGPVTDIDTPSDLAAVRAATDRRKIIFRFAANERVGLGHLHRCVTLAEGLQHHDIRFEPTMDTFDHAWQLLTSRGWPVGMGWDESDLYVKDTLDEDWVPDRFGTPWVALEDHGPSARHADLVVNALYPTAGAVNERSGSGWCVLRPEFLFAPRFEVRDTRRVLVSFGGTDPADLTQRAGLALTGCHAKVTIVPPPGHPYPMATCVGPDWHVAPPAPSMAAEMLACDLLICSAGRTLYEAAALGVPAVVLAQNPREATHSHLGEGFGNIYLGMGRVVTAETLQSTVEGALGDRSLRTDLSLAAKASVDGKGVSRIVHAVEGILRGL